MKKVIAILTSVLTLGVFTAPAPSFADDPVTRFLQRTAKAMKPARGKAYVKRDRDDDSYRSRSNSDRNSNSSSNSSSNRSSNSSSNSNSNSSSNSSSNSNSNSNSNSSSNSSGNSSSNSSSNSSNDD